MEHNLFQTPNLDHTLKSFESSNLKREELLNFVQTNIIGSNKAIQTPFGIKPVLYADYTASGRNLQFIEDYIQNMVMSEYSNTHTVTSYCGKQTGQWRSEARKIIHRCVGATEQDVVIFTGSGSTAAINKFISILQKSQWTFGSGKEINYVQQDRWGDFKCRACDFALAQQGEY